jgi:hypothetical protein
MLSAAAEQLDHKDRFRERHGCHRRLPAVDTCCLPCVNVELDLHDDVVVNVNIKTKHSMQTIQ